MTALPHAVTETCGCGGKDGQHYPDCHEDCKATIAARDAEIARLRKAMNHAHMGIMLALQVREDIEARAALDELAAALASPSAAKECRCGLCETCVYRKETP